MKIRIVLCLVLSFFAVIVSGNGIASFPHAPHDGNNGLSCHLCHDEDLTLVPDPNTTCLDCHDSVTPHIPGSPQVKTHSAAVIHEGEPTNPPWPHGETWEKACLDCHDPHFQYQLTNFNVTDFYLAKGTISNLSVDGTTFDYSISSAVTGWDLPDNSARWIAKSSSSRGLILVIVDTSNNGDDPLDDDIPLNNTFEITNIDTVGGTITVNGDMTGLSGDFGIIYGMLIKSSVNGAPVVFTGPSTFVDTDGIGDVQGICQVCHNDDTHPIAYWDADGSGTSHNPDKDCVDCHTHDTGFKGVQNHDVRYNPTSDLSQVDPSRGCQDCHGTLVDAGPPVIYSLAAWDNIYFEHNNDCDTCHTSTRANSDGTETIDPYKYAAATDPSVAYVIANGTGVECLDCHYDRKTPNTHAHDATHFAWGGGCEHCHGAGTAAEAVVSAIHANNCDLCHTTGGPYNADTNKVGDHGDGDATLAEGDVGAWTSTCETCHNQTEVSGFHGITITEVAGSHNNLGGSRGAWTDSGGTIPSNRAASYSGKIDQDTYGGLLDDDYNCADCHAADHTSFTSLEALQVHMFDQGSGTGNCLTCHNASMVADEIAAGKGASVTVIQCEDCHSIANGNGPSGEKMYQYDGVRHHKTMHAQAGNCTRCHADPRPADLSGEPGHAGTAAVSDGTDADGNTWNDGFKEDYGMIHPEPLPRQMACRLCHTNYETYTVNVRAEDEADPVSWNTSELDDLHGYNKTPPAHGLTVYADDYDARGTEFTYRDKHYDNYYFEDGPVEWARTRDEAQQIRGARQTTQVSIPSHRIDANDGSSKIEVYNFGACLSCHTVQLRHAAPIPGQDYDTPDRCSAPPDPCTLTQDHRNTHPYDTLRYSPGRSVFNDFRGGEGAENQKTWNDHFMGLMWLYDAEDARGGSHRAFLYLESVNNNGVDEWKFGSVGNSSLVAVPLGNGVNQLEDLPGLITGPYDIRNFDNGPAAPVFDDITITLAKWTGSWVYVEATSSFGAAQDFSFTYTGAGGPCNTVMTWNTDHYEGTCYAASGWTGTDTVTVSNDTPSVSSTKSKVVLADTLTMAVDDSYVVTGSSGGYTTKLLVLRNDPGVYNEIISLDDTNLNANCTIAVIEELPSRDRIDITCGATTGAMGSFDYMVQGNSGSDTATVSITATGNQAPTIIINEPNGIGDAFSEGIPSFDINYTLTDGDSAATVSMYYDIDTLNYDGMAIGSCAVQPEGTADCAWDTSGLPIGTHYVYGITDSPDNAPVYSDYGTLVISTNQPPVAVDDGTYTVGISRTSNFTVLANDTDGGDGHALSVTGVGADSCGGIPAIGADGMSVDYTSTGIVQNGCTFTYTVSDTISTDQGTVTVDVKMPAITVQEPAGGDDYGTEGGSFTIVYDANDAGDGGPISVDFFYDNNNTGEDGIAIAGCQDLSAKGTGLTCSWTPLSGGFRWVYGVLDDSTLTLTDYSPDALLVQATPPFTETFTGGKARVAVGPKFTWTSGSWDTTCDPWYSEIDGTSSGDTGPSTWDNAPYAYVEASTAMRSGPCTDIDMDNRYYLQSPPLDASTYDFYLSFDYNSTDLTGTQSPDIEVWVKDGAAAWVQHDRDGDSIFNEDDDDVISDPNNAWATETALDLSTAINSAYSYIRIVVRTSSADFHQDVAIDNIILSDTP